MLNVGDYRVGIWAGAAYEMVLFHPAPARGSNRERPERAVALFLPWEIIDEQAPGLTVDADSADSKSPG